MSAVFLLISTIASAKCVMILSAGFRKNNEADFRSSGFKHVSIGLFMAAARQQIALKTCNCHQCVVLGVEYGIKRLSQVPAAVALVQISVRPCWRYALYFVPFSSLGVNVIKRLDLITFFSLYPPLLHSISTIIMRKGPEWKSCFSSQTISAVVFKACARIENAEPLQSLQHHEASIPLYWNHAAWTPTRDPPCSRAKCFLLAREKQY